MVATFPTLRLRRLRQHPVLRDLVRETQLTLNDLVLPVFIKKDEGEKQPIEAMPGHYQIPINKLDAEIDEISKLGIKSIMLFGIPEIKDSTGSDSYHEQGIIQKAIRKIRFCNPDLLIMTDVCFCQYTDHGHCGFAHEHQGKLDVANDETLELLAKQAVSHVQAGAHMLVPSGMIDGAVYVIRQALDKAGFSHIPVLSHSVKYASALYGPFRQAIEGASNFGDRNTYQMDPANSAEALREAKADLMEGADILLVKPAHTYLDVIYRLKQEYPHIPLAAYHPSGEFAMLKAASAKGWIDEKKAVLEVITSIKRAGAHIIVTYYAKELAQWFAEDRA